MLEFLPVLTAIAAGLAALFAFFCWNARGAPIPNQLTTEAAGQMMRTECEIVRRAAEEQARGLRQEISATLANMQEVMLAASKALSEGIEGQVRGFGERLDRGVSGIEKRAETIAEKLDADLAGMRAEASANREGLRQVIERKLDNAVAMQVNAGRELREELGANFQRLGTRVNDSLGQASEQQKERLNHSAAALAQLTEKLEKAQESLRTAVEGRLDAIRVESAAKLEEMRQTVDEKLQTTLEARLGESFNRVVEHLERVHKGIGEMQALAANVGDLKNVLTNVKVRGTYGEVQLALLLEQFLSPEQYVVNACVKPGSAERVEFALKFPGDGEPTLLAIDSKFPREDFEHLQEALQAGDLKRAAQFRAQLEAKIRSCARDIGSKYINRPHTVDFAILFVPTESLYAEVLRQPGFCETIQREFRVMLAGPTNLAALLTAFQMGFSSLALQKRSTEVWQVLGAVRNEFTKYNNVVGVLSKQLNTAIGTVDKLSTRTRALSRTLSKVETLPNEASPQTLLDFADEGIEVESGEIAPLDSEIIVSQPAAS